MFTFLDQGELRYAVQHRATFRVDSLQVASGCCRHCSPCRARLFQPIPLLTPICKRSFWEEAVRPRKRAPKPSVWLLPTTISRSVLVALVGISYTL